MQCGARTSPTCHARSRIRCENEEFVRATAKWYNSLVAIGLHTELLGGRNRRMSTAAGHFRKPEFKTSFSVCISDTKTHISATKPCTFGNPNTNATNMLVTLKVLSPPKRPALLQFGTGNQLCARLSFFLDCPAAIVFPQMQFFVNFRNHEGRY